MQNNYSSGKIKRGTNRVNTVHPNYQLLKSEVIITLYFQLCSACYTALQMKNITRNASAVNPVIIQKLLTIPITNMGIPLRATTKVHEVCIEHVGMTKGTCLVEVIRGVAIPFLMVGPSITIHT